MMEEKKRKLVVRLKNILNIFINCMKPDVDDEEYYEVVESTKGEKILAIIAIVVSFMLLLAGVNI